MPEKRLILLTNDDGILSPGLWAAARALEPLGFVVVVAPQQQSSGAGRSMPADSPGRIHEKEVLVAGRPWTVHAVEGTPAQAVQHGVLEVAPRLPDLVVAGINYGENVGSGVTISGTVGAAMEAAGFNVPALAVSLQTDKAYHRTHSDEVDFAAAEHFTRLFAERILAMRPPPDVDVWKVEVPAGATPDTPWQITRLSRHRYFLPVKPQRASFADPGFVDYDRLVDPQDVEPGSDVAALLAGVVSVTPLSLDLTSRVDFARLARALAAP